jgi:hypothetical protein
MQYQENLHPWIVVQLLPKMQRVVRGRFRRGSEADGHLRALRRCIPEGNFVVMFDPPVLKAVDKHKEL